MTDERVTNPAHGPRTAASRIPPTRCPLDPVPGIEKLIICAAKTKAPMTPMSGTSDSGLSSGVSPPEPSRFNCRTAIVSRASDAAPVVAHTTGESSASDMCMSGKI